MSFKHAVLSVAAAAALSVLTAAGASAGGLANPLGQDGLNLTAAQQVGYYGGGYRRCYYKRVRYYDPYTYRYYYRNKRVCY